jgi:hypothetical protein
MKKKPKPPKEVEIEIFKSFLAGKTVKEISEVNKCSFGSTTNRLRNTAWFLMDREGLPEYEIDKAILPYIKNRNAYFSFLIECYEEKLKQRMPLTDGKDDLVIQMTRSEIRAEIQDAVYQALVELIPNPASRFKIIKRKRYLKAKK